MAQVTHGIYATLSHPFVYSLIQSAMGAHRARANFAAQYIRPSFGMRILDVGCGPANILAYLPDVEYWGFDISEAYIRKAKITFQQRGFFYCKQLERRDLEKMPKFDIVLAAGLLHHLDDDDALEILRLAFQALRFCGRLITVDPCLDRGQNFIARFLVRHDRGQNVRDKKGYEQIAKTIFPSINIEVRHKIWIPYTHCIMECHKQATY